MKSPLSFIALFLILLIACSPQSKINNTEEGTTLLNVSYDPTREFFQEYNTLFSSYWKQKTNQDIKIYQSHGGSGKQARSVIDGLKADIVSLALAYDIDEIAKNSSLLPLNWQSRLPLHSSPFTSTIVFLVRKNNPKRINDWADLVRSDIQVITPNPKASGGARWNYLAAWVYALKTNHNDENKAFEFMKSLYQKVPVLDSGARGSTTSFAQRGLGDVLMTWENEAYLAIEEFGKDNFDMIRPSLSILAEPVVAVIDKNTKKNRTEKLALEYLKYLYSPTAQSLAHKHHFRPSVNQTKTSFSLPNIERISLRDLNTNWEMIHQKHFADGGLFDQIFMK